ncbi:MAG: ABC transporter permease [Bacteroidales bacterium]|nr:ABC transporter permease [Bacteroidales bacterium]
MDYTYHIAKRLFFSTEQDKRVSRPAVRIALIGIAVGLAVMLISVAVVIGFKHQVESNVVGLSSHIQLTSYQSNFSYEMAPVEQSDSLPLWLADIPNVRHIQHFTTKPGIIKLSDNVQTVVFKGVASDFDWDFLQERMTDGRLPDYGSDTLSAEVLISRTLADLLELKTDDSFVSYFTRDERILARRWTISGIFDTHFSEFDKTFVLVDNRQIARLNGWEPGQTGGLEIFVDDIRRLPRTDMLLYERLFDIADSKGYTYYAQSVYDLNPEMFGWLDLLDMNVWFILILMIFVSGFNMISGLLILILERTRLIGLLKSLGADNAAVRRIFVWLSAMLIGKGLLWGNALGLGLCALQYFFHLIPLDPSVYYVASVPIEFNWFYILLINVGTVAASLLMMLLPTMLVSRIVPVKAIRFE